MLQRNNLVAASLLVAAALAGCGFVDGQPRWDGTVETLPNGVVRVTNGEQGMWRAGEEWRLEEELTLGVLEGTGPDAFTSIVAVEAGADGRIYVLDRQSNELRIFDAAGNHIRTSGRSGQGPGEYRQANGMEWLQPDTLLIVDAQGNRMSLLDRDGSFVRSTQRPLNFFGWVMNGGVHGRTILEAGAIYTSPEEFTPVYFAMHLGTDVERVDTLASPWSGESRYPSLSVRTDRGGMSMSVPNSPTMVWHVDHEGNRWYGYSDEYRIFHLSMTGDTLREIVAPASPLPVTAAELDEWEATDGVARFKEMGGRVDRSALPRTKPVFRAITTDAGGHLWVEVLDADGYSHFDVFDADGRFAGRLATGVKRMQWAKPRLRNDRLYMVARDDFDVERVVVFHVVKPAMGQPAR